MVNKLTDPFVATLLEGTIVERLVLIAGIVLILYAAAEILMVYADIWNRLNPANPYTPVEPVLRSFLAAVIGLMAVVLAIVMDFSWNPE